MNRRLEFLKRKSPPNPSTPAVTSMTKCYKCKEEADCAAERRIDGKVVYLPACRKHKGEVNENARRYSDD